MLVEMCSYKKLGRKDLGVLFLKNLEFFLDYDVTFICFENCFHLDRFVIIFLDNLHKIGFSFHDVLIWIIKFYSKDILTSGFYK